MITDDTRYGFIDPYFAVFAAYDGPLWILAVPLVPKDLYRITNNQSMSMSQRMQQGQPMIIMGEDAQRVPEAPRKQRREQRHRQRHQRERRAHSVHQRAQTPGEGAEVEIPRTGVDRQPDQRPQHQR